MHWKLSWVLLLALALMGCIAGKRGPFTADERRAMAEHAYADIISELLVANRPWRSGLVWVDLTVDQGNQLVDCKARSASASLATVVGRLCWSIVLPPIAPSRFEGVTERVITLRWVIGSETPVMNSKKLKTLQEAHAVHTLVMQGLGSRRNTPGIGVLVMNWKATSEGKVYSCEVNTRPLGIRKAEYIRDEASLARVFEVCRSLDMGPFTENGTRSLNIEFTSVYAPWMKSP